MCVCMCAEQCELLPSQTFLSDKHMFSCRTVRGQSSTGANLIAETLRDAAVSQEFMHVCEVKRECVLYERNCRLLDYHSRKSSSY